MEAKRGRRQYSKPQGSNLFVCGDHNAGTRHSESHHRRRANRTGHFISDVFAQRHRGKAHLQGNLHARADKTFGWRDGHNASRFTGFPAETGGKHGKQQRQVQDVILLCQRLHVRRLTWYQHPRCSSRLFSCWLDSAEKPLQTPGGPDPGGPSCPASDQHSS